VFGGWGLGCGVGVFPPQPKPPNPQSPIPNPQSPINIENIKNIIINIF